MEGEGDRPAHSTGVFNRYVAFIEVSKHFRLSVRSEFLFVTRSSVVDSPMGGKGRRVLVSSNFRDDCAKRDWEI